MNSMLQVSMDILATCLVPVASLFMSDILSSGQEIYTIPLPSPSSRDLWVWALPAAQAFLPITDVRLDDVTDPLNARRKDA